MSATTAVGGSELAHFESPRRIPGEAPVSPILVNPTILEPPSNTSVYLSWANWVPTLSVPRLIWIRNTCAMLQRCWKNRSSYFDRAIVLLTLILACFALWSSFAGAEDTKRAAELAKWTARKDFIEFCESHHSEPEGCNETELFLRPPPIRRRKFTSVDENEFEADPDIQGIQLTLYLSQCITFIALEFLMAYGVVILCRRSDTWSFFSSSKPASWSPASDVRSRTGTSLTSLDNPIAEEAKSTPPAAACNLHAATTMPRGYSGPDPDPKPERAGLKRTLDQASTTGIDNYETKGARRRKLSSDPGNPKFACPFYKYDPSNCIKSRTCAGPGWPSIHRLKEHIYRVHSMPKHFCPRCQRECSSAEAISDHLQTDVICKAVDSLPWDCIDSTQNMALRARSPKGAPKATPEEKWNEVYRIIFPKTPADAMPTPYVDEQPPSDNLRQYLHLKELRSLVHPRLGEEFDRTLDYLNRRVERKLLDIYQEVVSAEKQKLG